MGGAAGGAVAAGIGAGGRRAAAARSFDRPLPGRSAHRRHHGAAGARAVRRAPRLAAEVRRGVERREPVDRARAAAAAARDALSQRGRRLHRGRSLAQRGPLHAMRALVLLALTACAHVDREAARKSLIKADSDFAADVAARGVDAWVDVFAEDGAMMVREQPIVRGHAKIREIMNDLGDPRKSPPELTLRWKPLGAHVSDDATLGWTYGNAVIKSPRGEAKSQYVTVWRKQADGSWKVAV